MTDTTVVESLLSALGGGVIAAGSLAAWLGSVWRDRISRLEAAQIQIDVDLRLRRIAVYEKLWKLTALIPKWPRNSRLTYEELQEFSERLRDWYFDGSGMYLSRATHKEGYTPLQDELERLLSLGRSGTVSQKDPDDYESVRARVSALRTHLASDIASRRDSFAP